MVIYTLVKKVGVLMLIVCTSDIHNQLEKLQSIQQLYPQADLYLDAGDSERHDFEIEPFISVKGNCDHYIENKFRIVEAEDVKIYITHGDHLMLSKEILSQIAKNNNCDMIIHGHTHVPYYVFYNGVHILCPGSIAYPRSINGATYALIKIHKKEIEVEIVKVKR